MRAKPRTQEKYKKPVLTREEWRARRELRREKQRKDNVLRAARMHAVRLNVDVDSPKGAPELKPSIFVGCSGWRTRNGGIRFTGVCRRMSGSSVT